MNLETLAKRAVFSAFLLGGTACAMGLTDETGNSNGETDTYGDAIDNYTGGNNAYDGGDNTSDGGDATNDSEMAGQKIVFRTNAKDCDYNKEGTWIAVLTDGELKPYGYSYPGGNGSDVLTKIGYTPSVPKVCEMKNIYEHINTGDIHIPIGDPSDALPPPLPYAVFMEEGKQITAYMESKGFNGPLEAGSADLHPCPLEDYMLNYQEILGSTEEVICEELK